MRAGRVGFLARAGLEGWQALAARARLPDASAPQCAASSLRHVQRHSAKLHSAASSWLPGVSCFGRNFNSDAGQSAPAVRRPAATSPAMNSANSSIVLACRPWCASNNSNMREACTKGSLSAPLRVMAETVFVVIAASPTRAPVARAQG
jgi:hypothetical protein